MDNLTTALDDLHNGWRRSNLWLTLAWDDAGLRYKRSFLGPLWIIVGMGFYIAVLAYLWGGLLGRSIDVFLPWLAIGIITWRFISSSITGGAQTFVSAASIINNIPMPASVHAYRSVMKSLIEYFYELLIVAAVILLFPVSLNLKLLLFIPGLLIIVASALGCAILLGFIGARFRDFGPMIDMLMRPMFFLTPIIWMPDMLHGGRAYLAQLNPFTHYLAIVREPILGRVPTSLAYSVTISITASLVVASILMLSRHRKMLPYWV